MSKRPILIMILLLLVALVAGLGWIGYASICRERLNHSLIAAIKHNDTKQVLALLDKGADPNSRDDPLQRLSLWQLLLERLRGRRPAPSAAPTALLVCTTMHFESGGRIYDSFPFQQGGGVVEFHLDCPPENLSILKGLLEKGANVNVTDAHGRTPLLLATQMNQEYAQDRNKTIQLLLDYGANLHPDLERLTPLEASIQSDNTKDEIIARMLYRGANINYQDTTGYTPLICAVFQHRVSVIKMLLDHHADVNIKDFNGGATALDVAEQEEQGATTRAEKKIVKKIIRILRRAGAKE